MTPVVNLKISITLTIMSVLLYIITSTIAVIRSNNKEETFKNCLTNPISEGFGVFMSSSFTFISLLGWIGYAIYSLL